jgi:crotonobetainyl-CoA:carnitine CoA-transferase CaiB-like acyl-CoA transferase
MAGILDGIRVLDFGRYVAGPLCAALLADLGAEVIRVERPGGGDDRFLMPITDAGDGAQFLQSNRNKKSLTLDMSSPKCASIIARLVVHADVVIANLSPSALRHLGLDYETLKSIREDIILTSITAFGSDGELKDMIGFDGVGQAISGAVYLTGEAGKPYRSAAAFVDFGTGVSCAYGTLAAILGKKQTGKGMHVQASLAGTALNIMSPALIEHATGANIRQPIGNRSPFAGPSDVFAARDGWFIMLAIGPAMFKRWTKLVSRPELVEDPLYASDILRGRNGAELSRITAEWAAGRTREECLSALAKANIAASPVLTPAEVMGGALGLADVFFQTVDYPGTNGVPLPKSPVSFSHGAKDMERPPLVGEHTDEVLSEFGFGAEEIAALREKRVV